MIRPLVNPIGKTWEMVAKEHERRARLALDLIVRYGGIDGAHHLRWVLDQVVRTLAGDRYQDVVDDACAGEDGPNTHEWDVGIAP